MVLSPHASYPHERSYVLKLHSAFFAANVLTPLWLQS